MAIRPDVRHYFIEGLTARGYISLLPEMMDDWRRIYVLLGGHGSGKSNMIKITGLELIEHGYEIDFFRSVYEPDAMAGFVLPDLRVSMIDAMEVAPQRWRAPQVVVKFVDLGGCCDERELERQRAEITTGEQCLFKLQLTLEEQLIRSDNQFGNRYLSESGLPDQSLPRLEHRHTAADLKGPWTLAQRVLQQLQKSIVAPCFLHGLGSEGWINFAPDFLTDYDQIRLEGKETLPALNWVLREAQYLGQVIKIVLHPLHPEQVIGIVFPERNLAIWQGNPADLRDQGIETGFGPGLKETVSAWREQRIKLKKMYTQAVDFARVDKLREELANQILKDVKEITQKA